MKDLKPTKRYKQKNEAQNSVNADDHPHLLKIMFEKS